MGPEKRTSQSYNLSPPRQLRINITKQIGRNSPCYCGSGRKFKKCCMKAVEKSEYESR